jgi:nicotinamidase-related amidase
MSISVIDPNTALVVIDLQQGIVATPSVHPAAEIIARAGALADAFRRRGLPVVLVNVAGGAPGRAEQRRSMDRLPGGWTELVPELRQQPTDILVTKRSWGAFTDTGLEQTLKKLGVTQIVLAGIATSIGVESTRARRMNSASMSASRSMR